MNKRKQRQTRALAVQVPEALKLYEAASAALAACVRVDEVKRIRNKWIAVAAYAKQAKDETMLAQAREIRTRAERRAGQILAEMHEHHQRRGRGREMSSGDDIKVPTLGDLGISRDESSRWQALARLDPQRFEHHVHAVTHPEPRPIRVRYETVDEAPVHAVPVFVTTEETRTVAVPIAPARRVPEFSDLVAYVDGAVPVLEHADALLERIASRLRAAEHEGVYVFSGDLGRFLGIVQHLVISAERLLLRVRDEKPVLGEEEPQ